MKALVGQKMMMEDAVAICRYQEVNKVENESVEPCFEVAGSY